MWIIETERLEDLRLSILYLRHALNIRHMRCKWFRNLKTLQVAFSRWMWVMWDVLVNINSHLGAWVAWGSFDSRIRPEQRQWLGEGWRTRKPLSSDMLSYPTSCLSSSLFLFGRFPRHGVLGVVKAFHGFFILHHHCGFLDGARAGPQKSDRCEACSVTGASHGI